MIDSREDVTLDFNFHFSTDRLNISYLNPWSDAQCDFMVELANSPEFLAANGATASSTPDRATARRLIAMDLPQTASTGFGRYVVSLKPEGKEASASEDKPFAETLEGATFIGTVTMKMRRYPGAPTVPDIGFQFLRRFWGKGYATEAAQALLRYFEDDKAVHEFVGYCMPENEMAKKMFQRLGFDNRGMRAIRGLLPDGEEDIDLVWSKGLKRNIEEYGL